MELRDQGKTNLRSSLVFACITRAKLRVGNGMRYFGILLAVLMIGVSPALGFIALHSSQRLAQFNARHFACCGAKMMQNELNDHNNSSSSSSSSTRSNANSDDSSNKTHRVVLLRHGQSTWNRDDIHIGWTDVPLTEVGEEEARAAGRALRREGFEFDVVFASVLQRVLKTEHIVMDELDQLWVPEVKDWRLNERHYGDLIGKTKREAEEAFGAKNVALWASSYDIPPDPMSTDGRYYPKDDRRYQSLVDENGMCTIPRSECMKDVSNRVVGYWEEEIVPAVRSGKRVLVAGHANMLKALMQKLDGIPDSVVVGMSVPRATPMVYELDDDMKPVRSPDPLTLLCAEILSVDREPASAEVVRAEVNAF